mmetsp:Transcript_32296/g.23355  ORF Transcript_32296/g.23355 Transcript_32296/m.23355 type:complete len:145 (-) Transcript_32296:47-481(-)
MKARKPLMNHRVSIDYFAPEMLQEDAKFSYSVDWWALGCVLYELLVGIPPFFDRTSKLKLINKINNFDVVFPKKYTGINISPCCQDLISKLLNKDKHKRLGAKGGSQEVLAHEFFEEICEADLLRMIPESPFKPDIDDSLKYFD